MQHLGLRGQDPQNINEKYRLSVIYLYIDLFIDLSVCLSFVLTFVCFVCRSIILLVLINFVYPPLNWLWWCFNAYYPNSSCAAKLSHSVFSVGALLTRFAGDTTRSTLQQPYRPQLGRPMTHNTNTWLHNTLDQCLWTLFLEDPTLHILNVYFNWYTWIYWLSH